MIVLESNQNHATVCDTEICPTLPASMGMGGGYIPMIVMQRRFSNIILNDTEICPTLEAGGGEGGNNLPMIVETFGFKPGQGSAAQGLGYEKEVAPTLNTSSSCGGGVLVTKTYALGVAENCQESDVCSTLRVKEPYGGEALIVETLVFDEGQITCPQNGLHPKWGGQCHALSGNAGRTVVIIKEEGENNELSGTDRLPAGKRIREAGNTGSGK